MLRGTAQTRQLHNRPNVAMRLAAVLLLLVCGSTCMLAGLLARYVTIASGSDEARVAKFEVVAEGTPDVLNVDTSQNISSNADYTIKVENMSEVAVKYSVYVTFEETLPDWLSVSLENTQADAVYTNQGTEENGNTVNETTLYFYDVGTLGIVSNSDKSDEKILSFMIDGNAFAASDGSNVFEETESNKYSDTLDFEVYVNFEQID